MKFIDLTFSYGRGRPRILDSLSWTVPSGRTVLLGPNGAGKSTLLAIAAGVAVPRSGWYEVDGKRSDARSDRQALLKSVGWMPQDIAPVRGLRVREQVAYAAWLRGSTRSAAEAAADKLLELVGLTEHADKRAHELSGGQTRRMGLAESLVHRPSQLLLDEPTAGLDPVERHRFREILERLPEATNVLISTHEVDDLEEAYDSVAVMVSGQIVSEGSVSAFLTLAPQGARRPAEAAYANAVRNIQGHQ